VKLLFIHQNFPAQYLHIARHCAADPANTVAAVGEAANVRRRPRIPGVNLLGYESPPPPSRHTHHYLRRHEEDVRRGQAVARLLAQMRDQGFMPDLILVHPGWGEGLFIRLVYPDVPVLAYVEYWTGFGDPGLGFDPEFPVTADQRCMAEYANATQAVSLATADALQTLTRFQLSTLPPPFRERATVLFDGVDTDYFRPDEAASLTLPPARASFNRENAALPKWFPLRGEALTLTRDDTVITFVSRILEPYRGWPNFARALPRIQAACPEAHILIIGRTGFPGAGGYGPPPAAYGLKAGNWRDLLLEEVRGKLDYSRLHLAGELSAADTRAALQLSRAHVYLTCPFVLGYSPVEAMSCAAPLILSDNQPCREIADHGAEALFVDFHSPEEIAGAVIRLLRDPALAGRLGRAARERALKDYAAALWMPRWMQLIEKVAGNP
jgi:glycosyltransferase involved in cell wall biosynthesis